MDQVIEVRVRTQAEAFQVAVDDRRLDFKNGLARVLIERGVQYILSWWIMGAPGTEYDIEVKAENGRVVGSLPVRGRIASGKAKAGGTRMFSLTSG